MDNKENAPASYLNINADSAMDNCGSGEAGKKFYRQLLPRQTKGNYTFRKVKIEATFRNFILHLDARAHWDSQTRTCTHRTLLMLDGTTPIFSNILRNSKLEMLEDNSDPRNEQRTDPRPQAVIVPRQTTAFLLFIKRR